MGMTGLFNMSPHGPLPRNTYTLHLTQDESRKLPPVPMTTQQVAEANKLLAEDAEDKRREFNARGGFTEEFEGHNDTRQDVWCSPQDDSVCESLPLGDNRVTTSPTPAGGAEFPQADTGELSDSSEEEDRPDWCAQCQRSNPSCRFDSCTLLRYE
jgi:hypothetical protein